MIMQRVGDKTISGLLVLSVQSTRVDAILDHVRARGLSTADVLNNVIGGRNSPKVTAMHRACHDGNVAVIRSLMAAGARWDIRGANKATAKDEAYHLKKSKPHVFLQIMELLAEPMPKSPRQHWYV